MSGPSRNLEISQLVAEFVGTFLLVFLSCLAGLISRDDPLNSGMCVMMLYIFLTYACAPLSGSHFNPAVTCYLVLSKECGFIKG